MTIAYVYKWTELSTMKWYIGSRTAKNCHPNDGYICSSKIVKPMIKSNRDNWKREILEVGDPIEMRELEMEILKCLDAAKSEYSYNQSNGGKNFGNAGRKFGDEFKQKISKARTGKKYGPQSEELKHKRSIAMMGDKNPMYGKKASAEARLKMSESRTGRFHSDETKEKIRKANIGKNVTDETKDKLRKSRIGMKLTDDCKQKLSDKLSGTNNPSYKGIVIATNMDTGDQIEIIGGGKEIERLGFNLGCVSNCCNGKQKSHKGHTFTRIDKQ